MSFSFMSKEEICKDKMSDVRLAAVELYGIFLFANKFSKTEIKIITENEPFFKRASRLLREVFLFDWDKKILPKDNIGKFSLSIRDPQKIETIFSYYDYDTSKITAVRLNASILEDEQKDGAVFIRGAYLAGGSVSDPNLRYHLELVTPHNNLSREVVALLMELGFHPGMTARRSNNVIYFKDSTSIEDFLTLVSAPLSALSLMQIKIEKEIKNNAVRSANCDNANITKTVDAAQSQLKAIKWLRKHGKFEDLPDGIKTACIAREENPSATLAELSELLGISKPGINHRFRKLLEIRGKYNG